MSTIETLKKYANFEKPTDAADDHKSDESLVPKRKKKESFDGDHDLDSINLSYTINLNLPETSDITVFDAIFKSLKENLLKK